MDVPKTTEMAFGGPRGALINIVTSPFISLFLVIMFNKEGWNFRIPRVPSSWSDYFDLQVTLIFLGFVVGHALFSLLPFGNVVEGQPLSSGKRLKYRCNGIQALVVSLVVYSMAFLLNYRVTVMYDKLIAVTVTALIFSTILSIFIYMKATTAPKSELSPRGNTGIMIYDFFVGHELNPRIGDFDFKWFNFRLCLQFWIMLNVLYLTKAWEEQHTIPPLLAVVSGTQIFYLIDNLYFENNLLTMVDMMYEGYGYFAMNGFFAFCPLLYSLQPRFLLENPNHTLPWYCTLAILFMFAFGYWMYRGSNSQKNEFVKNPKSPEFAHYKIIPTESGRGLLASGWWGICRKPNYLGDLILTLSWSLASGFNFFMPYCFPIFITYFLIDREKKDSAFCKQKYKASWDRYCQEVKYRIFPYIY